MQAFLTLMGRVGPGDIYGMEVLELVRKESPLTMIVFPKTFLGQSSN